MLTLEASFVRLVSRIALHDGVHGGDAAGREHHVVGFVGCCGMWIHDVVALSAARSTVRPFLVVLQTRSSVVLTGLQSDDHIFLLGDFNAHKPAIPCCVRSRGRT